MANNKNGSLDTNLLIRLVLGDVPEQVEAVEKLLKPGSIFDVSDIAIFEMVYVLEKVYKQPRDIISQNVYSIINHTCINSNRKIFAVSLPLYIDNTKLSFVDCALTKYAEINKATPLYTFDADLAKACSPITQIP